MRYRLTPVYEEEKEEKEEKEKVEGEEEELWLLKE